MGATPAPWASGLGRSGRDPDPGGRATAVTALVIAAAVALAVARGGDEFGYSLFTDRDLTRALRWREALPVTGAELSGGGELRIPGAALPALFWVGSWLGDGAFGPFRLALGLAALSVVVLHLGVARWWGPWSGAVAAVTWALSPLLGATMLDLWNPTFLPLPVVAATVGCAAAARGEAWGWPMWAAGVAVGAQLHLSVALLGAAQATALVGQGARPTRRDVGRAAAVVVGLYSPLLVHELVAGAPVARAAWAALTAAGEPPSPTDLGERLGRLARILGDGVGEAAAWPAVWALIAAAAWRSAGRDRAVGSAAALVLLAYAAGVFYRVEGRYLVVVGPSIAWMVGAATSWRWPVAALLAAQLPWAARFAPGDDHASYRAVRATLSGLQVHTGWPLERVVAVTSWRHLDGDQPAPTRAWPAVDHLLAPPGLSFPGSGEGPCALLTPSPQSPLDVPELERQTLARVHLEWVEGPVDLGAGWSLVLYQPTVGRCPTTMSQRYVDTPEEAWLRAGEASAPGRWRVDLDGPAYRVGVTLSRGVATLHSAQLRGYADNGGWYGWRALLRPRLVMTRGAETAEVVLAEDVVGQAWEATPVSAPLPAGAWTVRLVADDVRFREGEAEPYVRRPVDVVLGDWAGE
jgi:hypothetical protein